MRLYLNYVTGTEHNRISNAVKAGDRVYDMFAGIGPFTIPAAKKKCHVYANDLNPESFKWLNINIQENKIKVQVKTFNMDGRDFIRDVMKPDLLNSQSEDVVHMNSNIHVIMNLPALAVEFLDVFVGLFDGTPPESLNDLPDPLVYCYAFSKDENPQQDIKVNLISHSYIYQCLNG